MVLHEVIKSADGTSQLGLKTRKLAVLRLAAIWAAGLCASIKCCKISWCIL